MKTAICAIIKNEHHYLEEWIEWHLGLGFSAIHLFEDKDSDSHEEICAKYDNVFLRRYEDDEEVQRLLAEQGNSRRQHVLYDWFAVQYKGTYKFVAFIDLDEFVFFADDYNLTKLCQEFEPYPCVILNWKMMGASGRLSKPVCGVIEAYPIEGEFADKDCLWAYKSFVNLDRYKGLINLHLANGFVNTHHGTKKYDYFYDKAWLNHYFTKSWEDWCERIFHKGGTLNGHRTLLQFFEANPDMRYLESLVTDSMSHNIPNGTHWIDKKRKIIAGGNTHKIAQLNNPIKKNNYSKEERLEIAIQEASKYGFKDNNRDNLVHFIWFGNNKMPKVVLECMDSWKKYLTNHTMCLWNEQSMDLSHHWMRETLNQQSWVFASDYTRLWAVYHYGGMYLDTDVEILKHSVIPKQFFAKEKGLNNFEPIATGLSFAAEPYNDIIKDLLYIYNYFHFSKNKQVDYSCVALTTNYLISIGLKNCKNIYDFKGFTIYPTEYFCPQNWQTGKIDITEKTIAIHRYTRLW